MKLTYWFRKIFMKSIPVKKNRIVFTSFNGHYSDGPKYICEEIYKLNPNAELIWLVDKKYKNKVPNYSKAVIYDSLKALYYYSSANIIIDNVYGEKESYLTSKTFFAKLKYKILKFLNYKKNQYVYTTWHGMPIKKMGRDQINSTIYDFDCPNTTMILNENYTYNIMNRLCFEKIDMKVLGSPRNDILYKKDKEEINLIKRKLGLPIEKKIIMFAPTFRSDGNFNNNVEKSGLNQLNEIDLDRLFNELNIKFGGDWVFVCRFHYHVEKMVNWDKLKEKYGDKIQNGNAFDDMMEYLVCTDILLSDISSALCDFFITEKPTFNLFPDYENYRDSERGLYIKIEELPFRINLRFNELIQSIQDFDSNSYVEKVQDFKKKCGYTNNIKSAKTIAEYILKERNML